MSREKEPRRWVVLRTPPGWGEPFPEISKGEMKDLELATEPTAGAGDTEPPPSYATSGPQRLVLLNLLEGRFPNHHLRGMSQFGGHQKVMAALYRKKMVESYRDQDGNQADRLTDLGRQIAKYWAEWGEPLRIDQHQKCPHDKYPTLGDECGVCAALGMRR